MKARARRAEVESQHEQAWPHRQWQRRARVSSVRASVEEAARLVAFNMAIDRCAKVGPERLFL